MDYVPTAQLLGESTIKEYTPCRSSTKKDYTPEDPFLTGEIYSPDIENVRRLIAYLH